MKLNKKSLLVACVLAAMSTSAFAASTTTSIVHPHLLLRGNRRKLIELHQRVLA